MKSFSRWIIVCLAALVFLAPLKFGTPVVIQSMVIPPADWFEWVFFPWPNQLLVILAFAAFVWLVLDSKRRQARLDALFVLPLAFLATQFVACLTTINRQVSTDTLMLFGVCVLVFYVAAWYVRDGASAARIFAGLGLSTMLVCLIALEQYFGGLQRTREFAALYVDAASVPSDFLGRMGSERVFATLVYPNALAGFLVVAFAPTIAWIGVRARGWDARVKWAAVVLAVVLVVGSLVLTGSRGGFVAFAAAATAGIWCSIRNRKGRALMAIGLVLALLAAVFVLAVRGGLIRVSLNSVGARQDYWGGAVAIAREHPWLGTGPGTFGSIYPKYKTAATEEAQLVHNNFLQMWSDSGVFAFLVFAAMWLLALRDAFGLARQRAGDAAAVAICAALTGWVVHGLVDFDLYVPGVAVPAFALLGAMQGLKETKQAEPVRPHGRVHGLLAAVCAVVVAAVVWVEGRALMAGYAHMRALAAEPSSPQTALAEAQRAVSLAPYNARYHAAAADAALGCARFEQAIEHYQDAIRADPYRASYHWRLARALAAVHGVDEGVLEHLRRAVTLNPTNPRYRQALAEAEESVRHSGGDLLESAPTEE